MKIKLVTIDEKKSAYNGGVTGEVDSDPFKTFAMADLQCVELCFDEIIFWSKNFSNGGAGPQEGFSIKYKLLSKLRAKKNIWITFMEEK